jgi:1-deoxy-D-xylulose-5-phosphate reductoisomerase
MKSLSLLGSTGSIGVQVLEVVALFEDRFRIVGLSAGRNLPRLKEQILRFRPRVVSVASERKPRPCERRDSPASLWKSFGGGGS